MKCGDAWCTRTCLRDYCSWPKKFREPSFARNTPATEGNPNHKTSRTQKLIDNVQSKNGLTRQRAGLYGTRWLDQAFVTGLYGTKCPTVCREKDGPVRQKLMSYAVRHNQMNQVTTFTEKVGREKRACAAKDDLKKNNIFSTSSTTK